jgi:hypothetical protein
VSEDNVTSAHGLKHYRTFDEDLTPNGRWHLGLEEPDTVPLDAGRVASSIYRRQ